MKRTELGIGRKSLERGSTFKTPRSYLKRSEVPTSRGPGLKRKRRPPRGRPTDEQIEARDLAAQRGDCWLATFSSVPCEGRWELAHLIGKSLLRAEGVDEDYIWDPRVVRASCARHHRAFDAHLLVLTRDQVPAETEEYAAEHGLVWLLDRTYGLLDDVQTAPEVVWP